MISFSDRFKALCRVIDSGLLVDRPRYDGAPATNQPRFNIQRTFLPGGKPQTMVFNLTRENAEWWVKHTFLFRYENATDESNAVRYEISPINL